MKNMKVLYLDDLRTDCIHDSDTKIQTDAGYGSRGISPPDLLGFSLASCMLTIMGLQARKLAVDIKQTTAEVEMEMSVSGPRRIVKFIVRIRCPSLVNRIDREGLEKAAIDCPVRMSLHPDIKVEVDFIWGV